MDQHYVPKVYLKQFESTRKRLYTLSNSAHKNSPHTKEVTRSQIGYLPDFYTINDPSALTRLGLTDKDAIEKDFNARVENQLEKLITKLLSPLRIISLKDAEEILMMFLSLKQRNPVFRKAFESPQFLAEEFHKRFNEVLEHKTTFEEILKNEGRMNFDEFAEFGRNYIDRVAHDPNTPQVMHAEGIIRHHQQEEEIIKEIANSLLGCDWIIFQSTNQYPFITSDNPGFCLGNNEQVHNLHFAESSGFFFPLTPRYTLMIAAHFVDQAGTVKQIHYRAADPDLVKMINRATFLVSYKRVVSNDENTLRQLWHDMSRRIPHLNDLPVYKQNRKG